MDTAKIFMSGRSQAVRLPKRYRLSGTEVKIEKKGESIVLTPISTKAALAAFLAMPQFPDFSVERENASEREREIF